MEQRYLGHSGLQVSRLCLGAMMFGGETDGPAAARIVDSARDRGVNFIDTADVYNEGRSEAMIGAAIKRDRHRWVVATKIGNRMGSGSNQGGLSRKWIIEAVEASLGRLDTDYVDILYFHRSFATHAIPEAVRAVGDLIQQGKIRYFGISNFAAWKMGHLCHVADAIGIDRPVATQPVYSIVDRSAERELIPAARHYRVGVVTYSPLARGVLTGKYATTAAPDPTSRAGRNDFRMMQTEWRQESLTISEKLRAHAAGKGTTAQHFALGWILANPSIASVIAGPRTIEQWEDYLAGASTALDEDDEALVDGLVAPGHASTPGYNDPAYPVEGRL